jgi:hypothetical protein
MFGVAVKPWRRRTPRGLGVGGRRRKGWGEGMRMISDE